MRHRSISGFLACCLALVPAACGQEGGGDPSVSESYRIRTAVEVAPGEQPQRLALPAAALVNLQRPDLADIRIFDAVGSAQPIALVAAGTHADTESKSMAVPTFPIVGTDASLRLTGVSLRIVDGNEVRIVGAAGQIDTTASGQRKVVGALLDTREVIDPVVSLELDATIPSGQPVVFTLEKSADLKDWQLLAEKVFFRADETAGLLDSSAIPLSSVKLDQQYVRATWSVASLLSAPVAVRSARVTTSRQAERPRIEVAALSPKLDSTHELRLTLPFATQISAIRLQDDNTGSIIPVSAYGRKDQSDPWHPLGTGILRNGGGLVELGDTNFVQIRLVADKRTAGFSAPPSMTLLFKPSDLVVQFNGVPPYVMAAGLAAAPNTYLTLPEIMPQDRTVRLADLPWAVAKEDDTLVVQLAASGDDRLSPRNLFLWAALMIAVGVLGYAIVRLMRR